MKTFMRAVFGAAIIVLALTSNLSAEKRPPGEGSIAVSFVPQVLAE